MEVCSFCTPAIKEMDKSIEFKTPEDRTQTLIAMIEAIGTCMDCSGSRLTCYPLIKLANELDTGNPGEP